MNLRRLLSRIVVFTLLIWSQHAFAYQNGITGRTTVGCGGSGCHAGTSSNTTLSVSGTSVLSPGQQTTLTLTIQNSSRPRSGCDIDFINSSGTNISGLGTISGQGMSGSNELTHSTPKNMSGGQSTWQFHVTAPSTPGNYTVRIAGNATTSSSSGDFNTTTQSIVVKGLTLTAPTGSPTYCGGSSITVQWTSFGVSSANIQLSTDGGSTYNTVSTVNSSDGSNSSNYTLPANTPTGSTYRLRVVDASDNSLSSAMSANFTVAAGISITAQPTPATQTLCEGLSVTYSVTATGSGLTYQWRKGGQNINGATAPQYTISSLTPNNAGTYDCLVTSSCGTPATSNQAVLNVEPGASITTQPQGTTICEGASATFTVAATGNGLTYKWKKNGTVITGATASSYTATTVSQSDAGNYTCDVSATCGSPQTSQAANLVVVSPPTFTTHPTSQAVCEGVKVTLTAALANTNGITYEWVKDGVTLTANNRINGVNTASLTINPVQASDVGNYQLRATALVCQTNALSNIGILGVNTAPPITVQPKPQVSSVGGSVTFSVTATGTGLTYQWQKDSNPINGATTSSYTIASVAKSDAGAYKVLVSNACATTPSANASLTVSDVPQPALSLSAASLNLGSIKIGAQSSRTFEVSNTGTAVLQVTGLTVSGTDAKDFTVDTTPFSLDPNAKKTLTVNFKASHLGAETASIGISSNASGTNGLTLSGSGLDRAIAPALVQISDTIAVGASKDTTFQLCNLSSERITVSAVNISGDISSFSFVGTPITSSLPLSIGPDTCVSVSLRFSPLASGSQRLSLAITSTQGSDTTSVVGVGNIPQSVFDESNFTAVVIPNPADHHLTVQLPSAGGYLTQVRIVDELGCTVYSTETAREQLQVDVQRFAQGRYVLCLSHANQYRNVPLIIMH